jgi:hypothetical protein
MIASHQKILSHVVCVVAGVCVAATLRSAMIARSGDDADGEASQGRSIRGAGEAGSGEGQTRGKSAKPGERVEAPLRSKDFREAWKAIARRDLTAKERMIMQKKLLQEWAKVDLEGAMSAALEGNWDYDEGGVNSMVPAFRDAFIKNPMEAWEVIQSGRLGLGSPLFRWQWVNAVSAENPLLVLSCFGDFSANLQKSALGPILDRHSKDPAVRDAILKLLRERPADEQTKVLAMEFYKQVVPDDAPGELVAIFNAAGTEQEKIIALQALAASLRGQDIETIKAHFGSIPVENRGDIVRQLLASSGKENTTELLNLAIASGDWSIFRDPMVAGVEGLVAEHARRRNPIAIAEWGLGLPDRPETQEVYRRAITGYIDRYPEEARGWIMSMPQGDWRRERALMEYSQNALWYKKNQEGADWAINQISDPKIKGTAMSWRVEWAQRNGVILK